MRNKLRYLSAALFGLVAASAVCQTTVLDSDALRTNTWSVYVQGGASKSFGIEYQDVQPSWITQVAPDFGAGLNYNVRPWLRLGLNYEFTDFARQQQFDDFQPIPAPKALENMIIVNSYGGLAYSDLTYLFHNAHLSVEGNLMELWKNRQSKRFNLYLGSGFGMMFAQGRTYTVEMGVYEWADPSNRSGNVMVGDNWATQSYCRAGNVTDAFNALYVPATLSAEYDICPQFTMGVKGEYKYVFNNEHIYKPDGLLTAALVLRYNFVGRKPDVSRTVDKYHKVRSENEGLVSMGRDAARQYDLDMKEMSRLRELNQKLEASIVSLKEKLAEVEKERGMTVYFDLDKAEISREDEARLAEIARMAIKKHCKLTIIAEASNDGDENHNMKLSERRLASVLEVLKAQGLTDNHFELVKAIGEDSDVQGPEQRKAEVYLKNW